MALLQIWMISVLVFWQTDWELRKDKDGIKVYVKDTEETPVKAFKGVATLDASAEELLAVIMDLPNYPDWLDRCTYGKVVSTESPDQYHIHTKMDMPFPVTDRDVVQKVTIDRNHGDGIRVTIESTPDYIEEEDGYVRIPFSSGYWQLTPLSANKTAVEMVSESDPGGSLPKWVVNMMIVSTPFNIMTDIEEAAQDR